MVFIHDSCFVCQDITIREGIGKTTPTNTTPPSLTNPNGPLSPVPNKMSGMSLVNLNKREPSMIGMGKPPLSALGLVTSSFLNTTKISGNPSSSSNPLENALLSQHMIFIDEGTVIHPRCVLECGNNSKGIRIGKNNIIEEGVVIINQGTDTLQIGNNNHIKAGVYICGHVKIGDYNVLECKCKIENNVQIEEYCIVNALCELAGENGTSCNLPSFTVVLGSIGARKSMLKQKDKIKSLQEQQIQQQLHTLRNLLPNYHKTWKI